MCIFIETSLGKSLSGPTPETSHGAGLFMSKLLPVGPGRMLKVRKALPLEAHVVWSWWGNPPMLSNTGATWKQATALFRPCHFKTIFVNYQNSRVGSPTPAASFYGERTWGPRRRLTVLSVVPLLKSWGHKQGLQAYNPTLCRLYTSYFRPAP